MNARPLRSTIVLVLTTLFRPWSASERARQVPNAWAWGVAILHVAVAAAVSTVLSSWTYLAGKGLLLGRHEMDMGQDDLPPDTVRQVAAGISGSLVAWTALLSLALVICIVVASYLYAGDNERRRLAVRGACGATAWFVVWAVAVLAANGVRHDELRRPAEAIRAYAQLRQQGFRGSSALSPGPPEQEWMAGRRRLYPLAGLFPVLWAIGLPGGLSGQKSGGRWPLVIGALALSWTLWIAAGRLLPWVTIEAILG